MLRKQEVYRKMADRQIEEVLAQIMSVSSYDENKYNRISTQGTGTLMSQVSNSADILNDSQDQIEDENDDSVLKDSYSDFMMKRSYR